MKTTTLTLLTLIFSLANNNAQEDKYKALFIYKVVQSLEFPDSKVTSEYQIGVVGNSEVYNHLQAITKEKHIFGKSISIIKITSDSDLSEVCAIFLPNKSKSLFQSLNEKAVNSSAVLIGETPGLGKKGAGINCLLKDGKLAFELNQKTLETANVKVSANLSSLASLVH